MKTSRLFRSFALPALLFGIPSVAWDAEACSCIDQAYLGESVPADGATDVPTNVVPWMHENGRVRLFDESATEVPITIQGAASPQSGCSSFVELFPDAALKPNTQYTVEIDVPSDPTGETASFSFTTGDGPLAESELPEPSVEAAFFDGENYLNSCNYARAQGCIAGELEGLIEITTLEDDQQTSRYVTPLADGLLPGGVSTYANFEADEICVEVRSRDLAGRRSQARTFCADTASLTVLPLDNDTSRPLCSSELIETLTESALPAEDPEETSVGCTTKPGPIHRGSWLLVFMAVASALSWRGRRLPHSSPKSKAQR